MSVYKRGDSYHYEFLFAGKRIRESAHTTSKTVAKEAEKNRKRELERTLAGLPATDRMDRIKSAGDMVKGYLESYGLGHRAKSVLFAKGRLAHVSRLLGTKLLPDITEGAIHSYMRTRLDEGVSGRTINMEVGELSRAIGHPWSTLWPKVRKMEERKDVGKALSPEEEQRLLDAVTNQASHS